MSISIQTSAAALATLESLTNSAASNASGAGAPASLLDQGGPVSNNASSIIDLSGGSASAALNGLTGSLATSASIADAAVTAGTSIESILTQMRQDAVTAADSSTDSTTRAALGADFKAGLAQIAQAVAGASVGGVNLIDGSVSGQLTGAQGAGVTLTGTNLSLGGPLVGIDPNADISDPATAASLVGQLGAAIGNVGQAVDQVSAQGQAIASHLSVVAQAGISLGGSFDPGLDSDSARLTALQLQQQLSTSSGAIANQSPQGILSLFR
jgi:flagellin